MQLRRETAMIRAQFVTPRRVISLQSRQLLAASLAFFVAIAALAPCQDPTPAPSETPRTDLPVVANSLPGNENSTEPTKPMSREERLRLHRASMMERLEVSKKKKEEAEANRKAEEQRMIEEQKAAQAAAEAADQYKTSVAQGKPPDSSVITKVGGTLNPGAPRNLARFDAVSTVLYFKPGLVDVAVGERQSVDLFLQNKGAVPLTRVAITMAYPAWAISPVAVYAPDLAAASDDALTVTIDRDEGLLSFVAPAPEERPLGLPSGVIASIVWEGVSPMRDTEIPFVLAGEAATAVAFGPASQLGVPEVANDGIIPLMARVRPDTMDLNLRPMYDGGHVEGRWEPEPDEGEVGLYLLIEPTVVRVGDIVTAYLVLGNPDQMPWDSIEATVRFDPKIWAFEDADRGAMNRLGTNANDAMGAENLGLDVFLENAGDNKSGLWRYRAARTLGQSTSQGIVAVLRFRALAPALASGFVLEPWPGGIASELTTVVRRQGSDILMRRPLMELAVARVYPALPAEESEPEADTETKSREQWAAERKQRQEESDDLAVPGGRLVMMGDVPRVITGSEEKPEEPPGP